MDEKTAEDQVKELRLQVYALRDRLARLEITLFRAAATVGVGAMVLGYFVPFLTGTDMASRGDVDSSGMLSALFGLGDSGDGPFSEEAAMAAIVFWVFAVVVLVALVSLLRLFSVGVSGRLVRFARVCGIVVLVGCAFGWVVVFALAGKSDGDISAFSPAMLSFTIGGAANLAAADWRQSPLAGSR